MREVEIPAGVERNGRPLRDAEPQGANHCGNARLQCLRRKTICHARSLGRCQPEKTMNFKNDGATIILAICGVVTLLREAALMAGWL